MKKHPFSRAKFLGSFLEKFPEFRDKDGKLLPEVVIVGKSNVGKSSLINHLFNDKSLARVSSTPGKTQTINFFDVDEQCILVDLPGYGFAKRSHEIKEKWAACIDHYLQHRPTIALLLLLIDARRLPSEADLAFVSLATQLQKPLLIIFTKSDTLSDHERKKNGETALKLMDQTDSVYYSIKDARSRKAIVEKINARMSTWAP